MKKTLEGLLFVLAVLPGCAAAPAADVQTCPVIEYTAIETNLGRLFAFDLANMLALAERGYAIQEGRCRMPPREAPADRKES